MIGAIVGDIIGSVYEFDNVKSKNFPLFSAGSTFTDDSLMTLAVAKALTRYFRGDELELQGIVIEEMQAMCRKCPHPMGGYGGRFARWLRENDPVPYNSFGNGAAMRVSPVAYFARDIEECKELSRAVTEVSHNHPEGIKGAECVAVLTYMALHEHGRVEMLNTAIDYYPEVAYLIVDHFAKDYHFDETCQGTVPQAIACFTNSYSFEDAIRNAMYIGGDSDTIGAITGAIAGAYYGVPDDIDLQARMKLDTELLDILITANGESSARRRQSPEEVIKKM